MRRNEERHRKTDSAPAPRIIQQSDEGHETDAAWLVLPVALIALELIRQVVVW